MNVATPTFRSLNQIAIGERVTVERIKTSDSQLAQKLMVMGLVAGVLVRVTNFSPFGDPIQIEALGYRLSLRRSEASAVLVSPLTSPVVAHSSEFPSSPQPPAEMP